MIGAEHELGFWATFVKTPRFLNGWVGDHPTPELRPFVRDFLLERSNARVLDVGSGVVSILHGTVPREKLTAVDPLGDRYAEIFDFAKHGLQHPHPLAVEELPFDRDFDVVHMSNALDHCQDPAEGFRRLEAAVAPGGTLIVQGFEDEGVAMDWAGMHQWNLHLKGRALVLGGRAGATATLGIADDWRLYELEGGRRWFVWMRRRPA